MKNRFSVFVVPPAIGLLMLGSGLQLNANADQRFHRDLSDRFDRVIERNSDRLLDEGREVFRFDTFGDEVFWGDTLRLHEALRTLTPRAALALGLKVDAEALPKQLEQRVRRGQVNLDDPAVTAALLKFNAVVGVTGFFAEDGSLRSVGLQCALCHSTVNDSIAPGIGRRLDGWANRDLDVGKIIASAPNIAPLTELLKIVHPTIDDAGVRAVLNSWGPGKFDAQLLLDGKATQPDGRPAATMIPNAYDLAGFNLHTWTGGWGSVPYWNAFVANLELRGIGNFFDPRLDNAEQYPIAAAAGFGHVEASPEEDRITGKLPALHFYQLAIPAPTPRAGVDFNAAAADSGEALFVGKADCNRCHRKPLFTEAGWNTHKPEDLGIESFQADRSPDKSYKTMNLAGLFVRERGLFMRAENKGRYYHDGRFITLLDVVNSYNTRFNLGLTDQEKGQLVEYLKSL